MYKWVGSGKNQEDIEKFDEGSSLFIYGTNEFMAVGGGGVNFGFSLDDSLFKGTTGKCNTFKNPPLCGDSSFNVLRIEVYSFK